jgi:hypothetical protein
MSKAIPGSILYTGAKGGDLVEGMSEKNLGMRLRIRMDQAKGENGWLKGRFELVAAGEGTYAQYLEKYVGQVMWAEDLMNKVIEASDPTKKRLTIFDRNSLRVVNE